MDEQELGIAVEWIENVTPEAREEAQPFVSAFASLLDPARDMTAPYPFVNGVIELPAQIERITIKRIHA